MVVDKNKPINVPLTGPRAKSSSPYVRCEKELGKTKRFLFWLQGSFSCRYIKSIYSSYAFSSGNAYLH